jgi:diadenylate cyclase
MPSYLKTIGSLLRNFSLQDLLDVASVAAIFYILFALLNTSRSAAALRALLAILLGSFAIYFAAQMMDLAALALVFSRFWTVAIIIFLIVFQAELRRSIIEVGTKQPLFRILIQQRGESLDAFCRAATALSEKQLGALFVFERTDPVFPFLVSPGEEIDALIGEDLIVTLFFSYNPLHDGAAIINGGRVARAAAKLPITKSADIPKGLGTRHHAGIEITTLCDAISVIVSEETGLVSIVVNGQIERGLDEETLRRRLGELLRARASDADDGVEDDG